MEGETPQKNNPVLVVLPVSFRAMGMQENSMGEYGDGATRPFSTNGGTEKLHRII